MTVVRAIREGADVDVTLIDEARRRGLSEIVKMLEDAERVHSGAVPLR